MSERSLINRRQFLRGGAASLAVGGLLARPVHDGRPADHVGGADEQCQPEYVDG
jgi:hypothetical protein